MARSSLTNPSDDLLSDSGAVLWSIVRGEQLEYPVTLNFIADVTAGYTYEAVVIEADNAGDVPTTVKTGGVQTTLGIRLPTSRGVWEAVQAYNTQEIAYYSGKWYLLLAGSARVSSTTPDIDPLWQETVLNKLFLQFASTLGAGWLPQPTVTAAVYGFFELRVTEPTGGIFRKTWKPVRGMVQIQFSPTEVVADV